VTCLLILGVLLLAAVPLLILTEQWGNPEVAALLCVIVPLLGLEWLTRKLLRLA
jgi:hypothetical protein